VDLEGNEGDTDPTVGESQLSHQRLSFEYLYMIAKVDLLTIH